MISPLFEKIKNIRKLSRRTWALMAFVFLLLASLAVLSLAVDLAPQVGSDFFFSSDDPKFQYAQLVAKIFPSNSEQLVVSAMGDIYSSEYMDRVSVMTGAARLFPGVASVKSLTSGPRNLKDAEESPLWKRILISSDEKSSNIIAFLEDASPQEIIPRFETAMSLLTAPGFRMTLAGVPYVVEMIRRNLVHDLTVFSLVALAVFGLVMVTIFRSVRVYVGTMVACIEACILTMLTLGACGIKIGILTVNLATIVFVMTLSHIIFLTHNWKGLIQEEHKSAREEVFPAIRMTFSASFWCMATTLLGFLSLLFVQAKPLRELGVGGSIGTVMAIISAYFIYPLFLLFVRPRPGKAQASGTDRARSFFIRRSGYVALALFALSAACVPGLFKLDTDPSLFSFFAENSELRKGLEYMDVNGGSSPLDIIVRDSSGGQLDTNKNYKRMWELQEALEKDPSVGSIISLPVLMAEGSRAPLAFLLNWESLLKMMDKPEFGRIARSFITPDHVSGRFLLRMKETGRTSSRIEVVEHLKHIVVRHGFIPEMIGGLYLLQGELSRLVARSLIYGLGRLILFFVVIAFIVSRSVRTSLAMVLSLAAVPVCIFGLVGYLRIPVDLISAPAVNVAIGMGIDSMIHMVSAVRRRREKGIDPKMAWVRARARLWQPVLSSMFIICAGFAIFALSAFPPTQRFGLEIVFGTFLASVSALFVLPILANAGYRSRK